MCKNSANPKPFNENVSLVCFSQLVYTYTLIEYELEFIRFLWCISVAKKKIADEKYWQIGKIENQLFFFISNL